MQEEERGIEYSEGKTKEEDEEVQVRTEAIHVPTL